MPPPRKKPPLPPSVGNLIDFVARDGIGQVVGEPQQGGRFWFECLWCWKRHDKYQELREHARAEHGWKR
jgi:hypothetical protein